MTTCPHCHNRGYVVFEQFEDGTEVQFAAMYPLRGANPVCMILRPCSCDPGGEKLREWWAK